MKKTKTIVLCCLLAATIFNLSACAKKADEDKPLNDVKDQAEKMNTKELRKMAETYKDAILAKKQDVEKLATKLKEIPITDMLGQEAKDLKADISNLNKSVSNLSERFKIYYEKLKEKQGDTSGPEI